MKTLEDFQQLMLGTRLKRLSDRLYSDVDSLLKRSGIELPAGCFAPLALLHANGPMGITELADALGQTHSAVSQISKKLLAAEIVSAAQAQKDTRRRMLSITEQGKSLVEQVESVWSDITFALGNAIDESGFDLMQAISGFEAALNNRSLCERVEVRELARKKSAIEIIPFSSEYRSDFKRLNVLWLEKFFYVEEIDNQVLSNPEQHILEPGGFIFFARLEGEIVGTSALIKDGEGRYELTKMSVDDKYQGIGIGKKLAIAAIEQFGKIGGDTLFLESNSRLTPAIKLYERLGFVHVPLKTDSHYQRADVHMVYQPRD